MEYSVKDIASRFSVLPETVRRWIRSGVLPANKKANKTGFIITESDIMDFLSNQKRGTKVEKFVQCDLCMSLAPMNYWVFKGHCLHVHTEGPIGLLKDEQEVDFRICNDCANKIISTISACKKVKGE